MQYIAYIFIGFIGFFIFTLLGQSQGAGAIASLNIFIAFIIIEKLDEIIKFLKDNKK